LRETKFPHFTATRDDRASQRLE